MSHDDHMDMSTCARNLVCVEEPTHTDSQYALRCLSALLHVSLRTLILTLGSVHILGAQSSVFQLMARGCSFAVPVSSSSTCTTPSTSGM